MSRNFRIFQEKAIQFERADKFKGAIIKYREVDKFQKLFLLSLMTIGWDC